MSAIYDTLRHQLHEADRLEIVQKVWNKECQPHQLRMYQSSLEHFLYEMSRLQQSLIYRLEPSISSALTFKDLIAVFEYLSNKREEDLRVTLQEAKSDPTFSKIKEEEIKKVIELSLRVFLTINIRSDSDARTDAPKLLLPTREISLAVFLKGCFRKPDHSVITYRRVPSNLKIVNIVDGCGLRIIWTSCLADHLRVDQSKKTVRIYHLKQCLDDHLKARGSIFSSNAPLLPAALLRETIWTLNLLFPEDHATDELLKQHRLRVRYGQQNRQKPLDLNNSDWGGDIRRPLDLSAYEYWGERLCDLLSIYDEGPTTLKQYLAYQKPYQVFNWVAALMISIVLALIFGLISSVTSIISTRATLKALDVAREALELQRQNG